MYGIMYGIMYGYQGDRILRMGSFRGEGRYWRGGILIGCVVEGGENTERLYMGGYLVTYLVTVNKGVVLG